MMTKRSVRTHVLLSEAALEGIDKRVGKRGRSKFIEALVLRELAKNELLEATKAIAGSLADVEVPGWETEESTDEWVRAQRRAGSDRLDAFWDKPADR